MGLALFLTLLLGIGLIIATIVQIKISSKENSKLGLILPLCCVVVCIRFFLLYLVMGWAAFSSLSEDQLAVVLCSLAGFLYFMSIYGVCRFRVNRRRDDLWDDYKNPPDLQNVEKSCGELPPNELEYRSKEKTSAPRNPLQYYRMRRNKLIFALTIALLGPILLLFPLVMNISSFNLAFSLCYLPPFLFYLIMMYRDIKEVWTIQMGVMIAGTILSNFLFVFQSELLSLILMPITTLTIAYTGKEILSGYRDDRNRGYVPSSDAIVPVSPHNVDRGIAIVLIGFILLLGGALISRPLLSSGGRVYSMDSITVTAPIRMKRLSDNQLYSKEQKATYTFNVQYSEQDYQLLLEEEVETIRRDPLVKSVYRLANTLANEGFLVPKYPDVNALELHTTDAKTYYYDIVVSEWSDQALQMTSIMRKGSRIVRITAQAPLRDNAVKEIHDTMKELLRSAV